MMMNSLLFALRRLGSVVDRVSGTRHRYVKWHKVTHKTMMVIHFGAK
jgi:hypothetical protein